MAPGKSRIAREHLGDTYFNMRQSGAWISYLPPVSSQAWRIIHNPQREEEIIANQTNFARKAEASGCMGLHFEANEMTVEDYDNELGLQQQRQSKAPSYDADDAALDQAFEYGEIL
ncbi:hypothetical protein N7478_008167 [Penicillium angulare]|uniref:uncharacterized protein n=1 Tax=Penicillium angulare TaxID=116970 RepID=UPI002540A655|nr:uncharacterized protein N7478_008167 [Penicillium angulare]KAJ5273042.1 hypothetical protein N7478_008167 [Penicillium angulare]